MAEVAVHFLIGQYVPVIYVICLHPVTLSVTIPKSQFEHFISIIINKSLMNPVIYKTPPALGKILKTTSRTLYKGQSCEEVDCCGRVIKKPINPECPIIEKDIEPSYFCTWKPNIPKLEVHKEKKAVPAKEWKKKNCYAGMNGIKCIDKKAVDVCFKAVNPRFIPEKKKCEELYGKRTAKKRVKRGELLPVPDWDHNCITK
ncbi:hypothetical protein JTB14_005597 [Gonioctena quinquepunctata]|nr:hypothetical protein JTB14_005597 [Gonioctena quinquepunctata]